MNWRTLCGLVAIPTLACGQEVQSIIQQALREVAPKEAAMSDEPKARRQPAETPESKVVTPPVAIDHGLCGLAYADKNFVFLSKATFGFGFNSNVRQLGEGFPRANGIAREGTTLMEEAFELNATWFIPHSDSHLLDRIDLSYSANAQSFDHLASSNTIIQSASLGYCHAFTEDFSLQFVVSDQWIRVAEQNLSNQIAFNPRIQWRPFDRTLLTLGYSVGPKEFYTGGTDVTDPDAVVQEAGFDLTYEVDQTLKVVIGYGHAWTDAVGNDADFERNEIRSKIAKGLYKDATKSRFIRSVGLELSYIHKFDEYGHPSSVTGFAYNRADDFDIASAKLAVELDSRYEFTAQYQYLRRDSNFAPLTYNQSLIICRFGVKF